MVRLLARCRRLADDALSCRGRRCRTSSTHHLFSALRAPDCPALPAPAGSCGWPSSPLASVRRPGLMRRRCGEGGCHRGAWARARGRRMHHLAVCPTGAPLEWRSPPASPAIACRSGGGHRVGGGAARLGPPAAQDARAARPAGANVDISRPANAGAQASLGGLRGSAGQLRAAPCSARGQSARCFRVPRRHLAPPFSRRPT